MALTSSREIRDSGCSYFAQGARCGHLEGRGRAGLYVYGEERLLAGEAAGNGSLSGWRFNHWRLGYEFGYRLRAAGEELDQDLVDAPLPEEA